MTTILIKRSNTAGEAFTTLGDGELAINQADSILFSRTNTGAIVQTPLKTSFDIKSQKANVVRHFGAKGDGITDDRAAIQAGINALAAQGGGVLEFPNLDYGISGPIFLKDAVTLEGFGTPALNNPSAPFMKGSRIIPLNTMDSMITQTTMTTPLHSASIRRLCIDGQWSKGKTVTTAGVLLSCINCRFEQMFVRDCTLYGAYIKTNPTACWINWFSDCYFEYSACNMLFEGSDCYINNTYFSNARSNGLILDSTGNNRVTGCMFDNTGFDNTGVMANLNAQALTIRNRSELSKGASYAQHSNVIVGNSFVANGYDIFVDTNSGTLCYTGNIISGNLFHDSRGNSIQIQDGNYGGAIMNNTFHQCLAANSGRVVFGGGTATTSKHWDIGPNAFIQCTGSAMYVGVPTDAFILGRTTN